MVPRPASRVHALRTKLHELVDLAVDLLEAEPAVPSVAGDGAPVAYYTAKTSPLAPRAFRRAAREGRFPSSLVGRKILAPCAGVDAYIASLARDARPRVRSAAFSPAAALRSAGIVGTVVPTRRAG